MCVRARACTQPHTAHTHNPLAMSTPTKGQVPPDEVHAPIRGKTNGLQPRTPRQDAHRAIVHGNARPFLRGKPRTRWVLELFPLQAGEAFGGRHSLPHPKEIVHLNPARPAKSALRCRQKGSWRHIGKGRNGFPEKGGRAAPRPPLFAELKGCNEGNRGPRATHKKHNRKNTPKTPATGDRKNTRGPPGTKKRARSLSPERKGKG